MNNDEKILGETNLPLNHLEIVKSMIKMRPSLIHPSIMVYKDILNKVDYFDEKYHHAEDYDIFFRISKLGEIINIPEKLMYLRKSESNISHKNAKKQIVNSFISRENYLANNSSSKTTNENFYLLGQKIKNSFFKSFYIKIHTKIVYLEFNQSHSNSYNKLIILKILRRFFNLFI